MTRRFRFAAVIVALITLFAFAVEGAAALLFCEPATGSGQLAHSGPADAHDEHGGSAPAHDESGSSHENHCPLGMTGSGSCAVASLPAGLAQVQAAPVTSDSDWIAPVAALASASVHPLFHPPRA